MVGELKWFKEDKMTWLKDISDIQSHTFEIFSTLYIIIPCPRQTNILSTLMVPLWATVFGILLGFIKYVFCFVLNMSRRRWCHSHRPYQGVFRKGINQRSWKDCIYPCTRKGLVNSHCCHAENWRSCFGRLVFGVPLFFSGVYVIICTDFIMLRIQS